MEGKDEILELNETFDKLNLNFEQVDEEFEIKSMLENILKNEKINHKKEIIKKQDLKHAHIYCKIHNLSGQVTGPLIEFYIQNHFKMTKNNASDCMGDLSKGSCNLEIKVSNGNKGKFNYVQIRFNHNCEYILTAYLLNEDNIEKCGELYIFKLEKQDMKNLVINYGHYAHGTIKKLGPIQYDDLNETNNKEYALRPKYGDKCWNELMKFRIHETNLHEIK